MEKVTFQTSLLEDEHSPSGEGVRSLKETMPYNEQLTNPSIVFVRLVWLLRSLIMSIHVAWYMNIPSVSANRSSHHK